jgi:RimJ/RimL family protein N-acetyltransferase
LAGTVGLRHDTRVSQPIVDERTEQPEITIDDLLVRRWRAEDAEAVHRACQDPEVQRWTPVPRPYEMAHAVGYVTDVSRDTWAARTAAHFGVFDGATGELLGSMGLVRLALPAGQAELGYWTAPSARGRGVATRAGRAVATWALDFLGVRRLVWRADVGNHVSRLVAMRIGFTIEGIQRNGLRAVDGDSLHDGWVGSLLPGEVAVTTLPAVASGSAAARQVATFSRAQPTLRWPGGMIRPPADDDVPGIAAACQDPETLRWTTVPTTYGPAQAESFVRVRSPRTWQQGDGSVSVIADADGAYCGGIDLRISTDDPAVGEIGFQVAPWARGRGLGTAAVRTLCAWAFDSLDLTRIVWRAHVGNDASRRVAEKAGFTIEGVQRLGLAQRGERRDGWVGSLLSTDPR